MVESLCSATCKEDGMMRGGSGDGECVEKEMEICSSYLVGEYVHGRHTDA